MIKSIGFAGALAAFLLAPACTDLTEVPQSSITPDHFYRNEAEATGGLASVYASLRDFANGYYEATEVTTDEIIVPTRGTDWYDNGKWLDLHHMTWTGNSPGTLGNTSRTSPTIASASARRSGTPTASERRCFARAYVLIGSTAAVTISARIVSGFRKDPAR